jgi:hypothetical protein
MRSQIFAEFFGRHRFAIGLVADGQLMTVPPWHDISGGLSSIIILTTFT